MSWYQNTAMRFWVPVAGRVALCVAQSLPLRSTGLAPIRYSPASMRRHAPPPVQSAGVPQAAPSLVPPLQVDASPS